MPEHVDGPDNENASIDDNETKVRETLQNRGARFADEIASDTGLGPSRLLHALASMARRGLVTNDRFEPMRASFRGRVEALEAASMAPRGRGGGPRRRGATGRPSEGRWSWVEPARSGPEARVAGLLAWVDRLLARYGVLCRETHAIEQAGLPPWPEMAAALNALELRGEVRRGFFVEGLSGVQYADAETAEALPRIAATRAAEPPLTLLSTLDPANLYGSGAPLDVPLLEGGTARLVRSPSNWLVQAAGRPVLIIEGQGKRLTGLDSASERELRGAVALLPSLAGPSLRILRVETYNQAPVLASPAVPWLTEAGLVRDLNAMSFYAGEW
jgi:ATP-dependent Lhr-like helicase